MEHLKQPIESFLEHLLKQGIKIWEEDGQLKIRASKGAMTGDLRTELAARKPEILAFLQGRVLASRISAGSIVPLPRAETMPVSFAQQRLWLIDQLDPGNPGYNIFNLELLQGPIQHKQLEDAFTQLVDRHEVLRTSFEVSEGLPVQHIHPSQPFTLLLNDLTDLVESKRQKQLCHLVQQARLYRFDLAKGPLLRACLVRLDARRDALLLTAHHIITDEWSQRILVGELTRLYQARVSGLPEISEPLAVQYADYAGWQRDWLAGPLGARQLDYWREKLASPPNRLALPLDRSRPAKVGFRGAATSFSLPAEVILPLLELAKQQVATPYMALLTAFSLLLHRYSGQDDLIVGTPTANRNRTEIEPLIGFFVNMLAIRSNLNGDPSFYGHLGHMKKTVLEAFQHSDLPFEQVVEAVQPERSMAHTPLFQVVFSLATTAGALAQNPATELLGEDSAENVKFELQLNLITDGNSLSGRLQYNRDLFDKATIDRMIAHFGTLLEEIVATPNCPVSRLSLVTGEERKHLHALGRSESTTANLYEGTCLHRIFEQVAAANPAAVALTFESQNVPYSILNARANRLARWLRENGSGPECLVALYSQPSIEMVVGLLAILKSGAGYLPVDPSTPPTRLEHMLKDSGSRILLCFGLDLPALEDSEIHVLDLAHAAEQTAPYSETNIEIPDLPDQVAYVIYTSGSTGKPKGVPVSHANVRRLFAATSHFGFGNNDVWTLFHSQAFDFSVWEIWGALLHGGRLVVVPYWVRRSPDDFYALLADESVTVLNQTPTAFGQLVQVEERLEQRELSLRLVIFGGEALHTHMLAPWWERHGDDLPQMVNMYGITETTVHVTHRVLRRADLQGVPSVIGRPIDDLKLAILDRHLEMAPIGVPGQMYVAGPGLARGYLNRPALTAERFVPSPFAQVPGERLYRSGDLARRLPCGDIAYMGRIDQQVKIRGFRIELGEIEANLTAYPGVTEARVLLHSSGQGGERLVAYCVTNAQEPLDSSDLRRFLGERLPEYMIPSAVLELDRLPLTANGKLDRNALPDPEPPGSDGGADAPANQIEEIVAGIWTDILGLESVGRDDNFFELGGHSLLGAQVASRIRENLAVELPLQRIFEFPTIATLAASVEELRTSTTAPHLPEVVPQDRGKFLVTLPPLSGDSETRLLPAMPLSSAQQRMWLLDQLEGASSTYNMPVMMRLRGPLDPGALELAYNGMLERHESLRTNFIQIEASPFQILMPYTPRRLPLIDLRQLPSAERDQLVEALARRESRRAFDLAGENLFRFNLIRIEDDAYAVFLLFPHIINDGWSMGVFFRDLLTLYDAALKDSKADLPPLRVQYADFAVWQQRYLTGEELAPQLNYWKQKLANLTLPDLPPGRPRPPLRTFAGAGRDLNLDRDLIDGLLTLAKQENVSLFMLMQTALKVLLVRITGQDDIVVGAPIAGRHRSGTENQIGFFLNTLVLRSDLSGTPSFREALRRVRTTNLEAYDNQDVPFEQLLKELNPKRDPSRTPFFQVSFNMLYKTTKDAPAPAVHIEPIAFGDQSAKFDLTFYLNEHENGLHLHLHYNINLFKDVEIEILLAQYESLLKQVARDSGRKINAYSLTPQRTKAILPCPTDPLDAGWPGSVSDLFARQAQQDPHRTAVVSQEETLSYGELEALMNQVANLLNNSGVGPGDIVAILGKHRASLVWSLLGTLRSGAAFLILDPSYPLARISAFMDLAKPKLWLQLEPLEGELAALAAEKVPEFRFELGTARESVTGDGALAGLPADHGPDVSIGPDDLAYLTFTSGSTGQPKGIMGRHSSLTHFVPWMSQTFGLGKADRFSLTSGLAHDPLHRDIFTPLCIGARICIPNPDYLMANRLAAWMQEQRITVSHLTPAMGQILAIAEEGTRLSDFRYAFFGGDILTRHDVRRLLELAPKAAAVNLYGASETQRAVSYYRVDAHSQEMLGDTDEGVRHREAIAVGKGMIDVQLLVINQAGLLAGVGEVGHIYVRSPHIGLGYYGNPELTARSFRTNPFTGIGNDRIYHTGDIGRYRHDGTVEHYGRGDRQIKIRGFRIEPGEIEARLAEHPAVEIAVVIAFEERAGERQLVGYVQPRAQGAEADQLRQISSGEAFRELREFLKAKLPDYMVPSVILVLASMPLNPNGKVKREALPTPDPGILRAGVKTNRPRDNVELMLVQIWEEVLGVSPIGIRDDFFELGGHSLLAIRIMARVEQEFGKDFYLASFFQGPTIEQFAALLRRNDRKQAGTALVPIQSKGTRPPFFCIHPGGGTVLCYVDLARELGEDQPFYGLQSRAIYREEPDNSIEEMARNYIDTMRSVQKEGPYHLGGWSMGGLIAFEMACQLRAQEETVATCVIMDSFPLSLGPMPEVPDELVMLGDLAMIFGADAEAEVELPLDLLRSLSTVERVDYILGLARKAGVLPPEVGTQQLLKLWQVFRANFVATRSFVPGVYPGELTLIRAEEMNPAKKIDLVQVWGKRAGGGLQLHTTKGNHLNMMAQPQVTDLAKILRSCLDRSMEPILECPIHE